MRIVAVLAFLASLAACRSIKIPIAGYSVVRPSPGEPYRAGVAKVDITPPPGYPMGGHSIGGRFSRGYWTRLYARAFYFQDGQSSRLALVSCDLFAIPAGLRAAVAHDLQFAPESLIISVTHTHHGPAGYMSSSVFNFGGPLPGYDPGRSLHCRRPRLWRSRWMRCCRQPRPPAAGHASCRPATRTRDGSG